MAGAKDVCAAAERPKEEVDVVVEEEEEDRSAACENVKVNNVILKVWDSWKLQESDWRWLRKKTHLRLMAGR